MKLATWIKIKDVNIKKFAKKIGKNRGVVHKYIYESVIPKRDVMVKIYCITQGAVSANDFYGLSEKLFDNINSVNFLDISLTNKTT